MRGAPVRLPVKRVIERGERIAIELLGDGVRRGFGESRRGDVVEYADRVVTRSAPERLIEPAEKIASARMPRPPEIHGQLGQPLEPGRHGRKRGQRMGRAVVRIVTPVLGAASVAGRSFFWITLQVASSSRIPRL